MNSPLFESLQLPNQLTVKNRIVKAAMEENMSNAALLPSDELINLYRTWANGGAGMLITGNVMIDKMAMTGPGGVALEQDTDLTRFKAWAKQAKQDNTKVLMQISHPGRQVFKKMGGKVYSPSDVPLKLGRLSTMFEQPTPMTEQQIQDVIGRFATTAQQAYNAGFDGVQIHAAHGYLIAQFLSPITNKRQDKWGGSIENRARLLVEIIKAVKASTSNQFVLSIKLNSADFQRGGFNEQDALEVVNLLQPLGIDLLELSGGSYESPAMQGITADGRTLAREAYFLEFADAIAAQTTIPIMTTGGIRRKAVAESVLENHVQMVGIATALAMTPDLPNRWQQGEFDAPYPKVTWKKRLRGLAIMALVKRNLRRLGSGKHALPNMSTLFTFIFDQIRTNSLVKRYHGLLNRPEQAKS